MGFYEELSKYYDIIFPAAEDKVNLLNTTAKEGKYVLDIACGTGNYSIELAKKGYIVDGIDLDSEMIKSARNKASKVNLDINFIQGDMRKVGEIFKDKKYDLIYCIGNSLVHLENEEEIQNLLNDISKLTAKNGKLVIQIVNYDRILEFNVDHLPTISRKEAGVEFVRNYKYDKVSGKILFNTKIIVTDTKGTSEYENSVPLYPLKRNELVHIVERAGFKNIKVYGSFKKDDYTIDSFPLVLIAEM